MGALIFGTTGRNGRSGLCAFGWPYIRGHTDVVCFNRFAVGVSMSFRSLSRVTILFYAVGTLDVGSFGTIWYAELFNCSIVLSFLYRSPQDT